MNPGDFPGGIGRNAGPEDPKEAGMPGQGVRGRRCAGAGGCRKAGAPRIASGKDRTGMDGMKNQEGGS